MSDASVKGLRYGRVMILTDQDVEDLAAYFSAQTLRPTGETEPSKFELGQRIFRAGIAAKGVPSCAGCHGPSGRGIAGAAFPATCSPCLPTKARICARWLRPWHANQARAVS